MYVVPLAVAVPIIAVALVIYCKYKAWTMKPVPLPESLVTFFFPFFLDIMIQAGTCFSGSALLNLFISTSVRY